MSFGVYTTDGAIGWMAEMWRAHGRVAVRCQPTLGVLKFSMEDSADEAHVRATGDAGLVFVGAWVRGIRAQPMAMACVSPSHVSARKFAGWWLAYAIVVMIACAANICFDATVYEPTSVTGPASARALGAFGAFVGAWLLVTGYGRLAAALTSMEAEAFRDGANRASSDAAPANWASSSYLTSATTSLRTHASSVNARQSTVERAVIEGRIDKASARNAKALGHKLTADRASAYTRHLFNFTEGDHTGLNQATPWLFAKEPNQREVVARGPMYFTPFAAYSRTLGSYVFEEQLEAAGYGRLDGMEPWVTYNCSTLNKSHNNFQSVMCALACIIKAIMRKHPSIETLVIVGDSTLAYPFNRWVRDDGSCGGQVWVPDLATMSNFVLQLEQAARPGAVSIAKAVACKILRAKANGANCTREEVAPLMCDILGTVLPECLGLQVIFLASSGSTLAGQGADCISRQIRAASILWPTAPIAMVGGWNDENKADLAHVVTEFLNTSTARYTVPNAGEPPHRSLDALLAPFSFRVGI